MPSISAAGTTSTNTGASPVFWKRYQQPIQTNDYADAAQKLIYLIQLNDKKYFGKSRVTESGQGAVARIQDIVQICL